MATFLAIYISKTGKRIPRLCRASGFLEKSKDSEYTNEKALADVNAEILTPIVDVSWDSSWVYQGTQDINKGRYHHYLKKSESQQDSHLWVTTEKLD